MRELENKKWFSDNKANQEAINMWALLNSSPFDENTYTK